MEECGWRMRKFRKHCGVIFVRLEEVAMLETEHRLLGWSSIARACQEN
jgi:hypothetical protein